MSFRTSRQTTSFETGCWRSERPTFHWDRFQTGELRSWCCAGRDRKQYLDGIRGLPKGASICADGHGSTWVSTTRRLPIGPKLSDSIESTLSRTQRPALPPSGRTVNANHPVTEECRGDCR